MNTWPCMSETIIFVGPKKTGTTSVYDCLRRQESKLTQKLLRKESNVLIDYPLSKLNGGYSNIIDISPEYYTSWRALVKAELLAQLGLKIHIVVISRAEKKRVWSHIDYMRGKRMITDEFIEEEWECILNSSQSIWERYWSGHLSLVTLHELPAFLQSNFNISVTEMPLSNEGGLEFRNSTTAKVATLMARLLRRFKFSSKLVEMLSPALRRLVYVKRNVRSQDDIAKYRGVIDRIFSADLEK